MSQYLSSLTYSTLQLSNIYFYISSGYFDIDSTFKPLLHTWSLATEEQFYIFWPLLLLAVFKFKSSSHIVLALSAISLLSNFWALNSENTISEPRSAIYFLTPFRVFEFGLGALLCWAPKNIHLNLNAISVTGLSLILVAAFQFDNNTIFPSYNALLPCFGTALQIYAGKNSIIGKILSLRPLVHLGILSYSLYLVHWPIFVFYKYSTGSLTPIDKGGLLITTLGMGYLLHKFIEVPFRYGTRFAIFSKATPLLYAILPLAFVGISIYASTTPDAADTERSRFDYLNESGCYILREKNCKADAPLQILTFGNSHELDAYNSMIHVYGDNPAINITSFGTSYGCSFRVDGNMVVSNSPQDNPKSNCEKRAEKLNDREFIQNLDIIVFSAHKPLSWGKALIDILSHLRSVKPNLKIIFFSGYIGIRPHRCDDIISRFGSADFCKSPEFVDYFAGEEKDKILELPIAKNDFIYIDKTTLLCRDRKISTCVMSINGTPAFLDGDHLTVAFANLVGERASVMYRNELRKFGLNSR